MLSPFLNRHRLICAAVGLLMPAAAHAADANPLSAERWKTRPLVLLAPRADDPLLVRQQDILQLPANQAAMAARDMVVYTVVGDVALRDDVRLDAGQARALRAALNAPADAPAAVVLVGKDGGVKLVRDTPITAEELFGTIDAMPMRRGGGR